MVRKAASSGAVSQQDPTAATVPTRVRKASAKAVPPVATPTLEPVEPTLEPAISVAATPAVKTGATKSSSARGSLTKRIPAPRRSRTSKPAPRNRSRNAGDGRHLNNMSEIRHFFRTDPSPIFFVGASAFNLLGLDRWVRGFSYITYYDSWEGTHPRVFTPADKPYIEFESGEEINNWLLTNHEVRAHIEQRTPAGVHPKIVMVFFNEETEHICQELGYELILPPAALRERLDSKMETTRIASSAGVDSVPNVMTTVDSWADVLKVTKSAKLGTDLVIQTAYGDSGKTTYFVTSEEEFNSVAEHLRGEEVKIMKRINNRPIAVEAVITHHGTIVGPCMTEITGHKALTPYRGGWAGNEMYPDVLAEKARHATTELVRKLGDRLAEEGYRGFFEVDVLLDTDTDEVYLGELNPRISGASAITNVTAGAYADVPLFVFHLLEYSGVEFTLDVDEINARWEELASEDEWSHMVIKHTDKAVEHIDAAPTTGLYVLDGQGRFVFAHRELDWHLVNNESEAFYLRIYGPGDYRWKGADLGILVTKGRLQGSHGGLTIHARHLIESIRSMYRATPLPESEPVKWPAPAKGN
ncbi:biotin carboxylase [Arthrobacter sp. RAF14]|uniref:biotin carboxylase n=1 Tax=Arthrobacter sp. RAF14 TaxID=3233051 RepID=UPI003F927DFC